MGSLLVDTPAGRLCLSEERGVVTECRWTEEDCAETSVSSPVLNQAKSELLRYFAGELQEFTVPFRISGSPFRQSVLQELCKIPYGMTATYGEIANKIGKPGAARAVGSACRTNPLAVIIPCHRVVGKYSPLSYTGPAGAKELMLSLEKKFFNENLVD